MLQRSIDAARGAWTNYPTLPAAQNRPREDYPTVLKRRFSGPKLAGTHVFCLFCAAQHRY